MISSNYSYRGYKNTGLNRQYKTVPVQELSFTGNKKHSKLKKVAGIGAAVLIAVNMRSCSKIIKPPEYSISKIEQQANDLLHNFKFEKADLVHDINNIMRGQKLSDESLQLYMETITSPKSKVYMSENAGQMMDVLAIAAQSKNNKDLVDAKTLKPYLTRALQYDEGSILNELPDTVSGDGEPWHYIAAAMLSKSNPEILEHMPQAEKDKLRNRGFFESVANDIKGIFGKGEEKKHYLGDILDSRDYDYKVSILSDRNNWPFLPSDNKWFGPASVGYAIRGKLDNLKGMSTDEIEAFRLNYVNNKSNHAEFAQNPDYREKVISSYIVFNLVEAIKENSGKVNSGLSAMALQEAGYMSDKLANTLLRQLSEEVPKMHLFTNETKKMDAAIKTYVIAKENKYNLIAPETRAEIRKFEVEHPKSTASSVFKLAEDFYQMGLSKEAGKHEMLETKAYLEIVKPDKSKNMEAIRDTSQSLIDYNNNMMKSVRQEIKVEELADPKGDRIKTLKEMSDNLAEQNKQLQENIALTENVKKTNMDLDKLKDQSDTSKSVIDDVVDFCSETYDNSVNLVSDTVQNVKNLKNIFDIMKN